jgi:PST family polysaccharide transporter
MTDYFEKKGGSAELAERSVSGSGFQFVGKAINTVMVLASTAVLARLLSPGEFGLKAMAWALVGIVGIFSNLGLKRAIIQREDLTPTQASSVFWLNLAFSVGLILASLCIAPLGAWFYSDFRIFGIIAVASFQFLFSAVKIIHLALLRRKLIFRDVMIASIVATIFGQGCAIAAAYYGMGYWALVIAPLASHAAEGFVAWTQCEWRPSGFEVTEEVKALISFGAYLSVANLASYVNRNSDDILLGRYGGPASLGLYNRAYRLFQYPMLFVASPITSVAIPLLSRLHGDDEEYRSSYYSLLSKMLLITTVGGVMLAGTSDFVVQILLGPKWHKASPILAVLSVCVVLQPIGKTCGWIYTSQDRTDEAMKYSLFVSTPVSVTAFVVGLPWGALGVATAYTVGSILIDLPLNVWIANRRGPVDHRGVLRVSLPFLGCAAVSGLTVYGLRQFVSFSSTFGGFACCLLVTGLAYLFSVVAFAGSRETLRDSISVAKNHIERTIDAR